MTKQKPTPPAFNTYLLATMLLEQLEQLDPSLVRHSLKFHANKLIKEIEKLDERIFDQADKELANTLTYYSKLIEAQLVY